MKKSKIKRKESVLGKSLIQTGFVLFVFAIIFSFLLIIIYLLKLFFNITIFINDSSLSLLVTLLSTILTALYVYNSQKSESENERVLKQKDLLKVLLMELNFLENNFKSYQETFSKNEENNKYPLYELWDLDVSIYLRTLDYKIEREKTIHLKENLMIIKDKLLLINNFKKEALKLEKEKETNPLIKKIGAIKMIRENITRIISEDVLPIIEKSKELIKEKFDINSP